MNRVSVVIVTYNNVSMLCDLLQQLGRQTRLPDEIIVVDNASSDGTQVIIGKRFPSVRYIRMEENSGSSGGYQVGIQAAVEDCDLFWTLDDDVCPAEDALEELLKGMALLEKRVRAGAVRSVWAGDIRENAPWEIDVVPWRGGLFKSSVVKEVGLPRNDYFIYGEDLEFSLRLHKFGYKMYWIPASRCVEIRQEKTDLRFMGTHCSVYSSPFRLYYAFRNEANIYLEYRFFKKLVRLMIYALKVIALLLLTDPIYGIPKMSAVLKGICAGYRGELGKDPNYLPPLSAGTI